MTIEDSPFMKRIAQRGKSGHGTASEKRVAKSLAAQLTPASGAIKGAKGDMKLSGPRKVLMEAKSTIHMSMSIEQAWLTKINHEAMGSNAIPALSVSFVMPDGKLRAGTNDWVMIPKAVFQELIGE